MASENPTAPDATEPTTADPILPQPPSPGAKPRPGESGPPPADDAANSPTPEGAPAESRDGGRRSRFEAMLPRLIRRRIEKGIEAGLNTFEKSIETGRGTTDAVREVLHDVKIPRDVASAVAKALTEAKLPRELASAVFSQIDDTKNDVLRIVAREVRDFLEATDISGEIKKALTSLSFEVRTEVRFIPNEAGTGVKADVQARSRVKRNPVPGDRERDRPRRRNKLRTTRVDPQDDGEETDD